MSRERVPVHHNTAEEHIDDVAMLVVVAGALRHLQNVARMLHHAFADEEAGGEFPVVARRAHDDGDGAAFDGPHSLSAVHNALAPSAWHFTPALNDSTAYRQSTSYTSILELDGGAAPGRRSRALGITYDRALRGLPTDMFFIKLNVSW